MWPLNKDNEQHENSIGTLKQSKSIGFGACFCAVFAQQSHTDSSELVSVPHPDKNKSALGVFFKFNAELATCLQLAPGNSGKHSIQQQLLQTKIND